MSLMSPAKHERIERHIMRQRGAGARAVNADFGFSFEGFGSSNPASQETRQPEDGISSEVIHQPAVKRRKVVGEAGASGTKPPLNDEVKGKPAKAKRRFDVETQDAPKPSRQASAADADDSFVGVKKRKPRGKADANAGAQAVQVDAVEHAASPAMNSEKDALQKPKRQRRQPKKVVPENKDLDMHQETAALDEDVPPKPKRRQRATGKTKPSVKQTGGAVISDIAQRLEDADDVELHDKSLAEPQELTHTIAEGPARPETKKRTVASSDRLARQVDGSGFVQHSHVAQVAEHAEQEVRPKRRAPRKAAKRCVNQDHAPKTLADDSVPEKIVQKQRARKMAGTVDAAQSALNAHTHSRGLLPAELLDGNDRRPIRGEEEPQDNDSDYHEKYCLVADNASEALSNARCAAFSAASTTANSPAKRVRKEASVAQDEEPTSKPPRQRKAAVLREDDAVNADAAPVKKTRPTAGSMSMATKPHKLESTPPRLERRPLQEADANCSPSPRKSRGKSMDVENDLKALIGKSKRKREIAADDDSATVTMVPRRIRKMRAQQEESPADEVGSKGAQEIRADEARSCAPDRALAMAKEATSRDAHRAGEQLPPSKQQYGIVKPSKAKAPLRNLPPSKLPTSLPTPPPSNNNALQDKDDDDVDWLFTAPDSRTQSKPIGPSKGKTSAGSSRRTKLPDIDLDDLIADVAAFARTDAATNVGAAKKGRRM